ncbi:putative nitroreductase [Mycobacteroides franklinii]|uniref:Putative nitroreductase n=2 Tax=Mycobacteroides franklinii TaxID=948102 RepID=A0A4R8QYF3_9MYCO|nr:putative nitroreductase [Mycobacteroides franklinii]TDZ48876.1 putative nitroreductase [Mycobacteroides franklinii]TDZ59057.1 putative nitroreductase [Mycobacteroides franklinii]TDZ66571.1 putative nitroreductase [Mycobacteroides franklinii]TDZ72494.1 putative nitroreductase [Mycobacteroides franklinii]
MRGSPSQRGDTVVGMPLTGEYEPSGLDWSQKQVTKIIESGTTDGTTIADMPVILLTSLGAKSGKLRKIALMRVEHDGEYAIVASLGGAPKNPVWYYNVKENPLVELQDGSTTKDYQAREVFGDEKAPWWDRAVEAYPPYAEYQTKTDRQIPVFVLTPVS